MSTVSVSNDVRLIAILLIFRTSVSDSEALATIGSQLFGVDNTADLFDRPGFRLDAVVLQSHGYVRGSKLDPNEELSASTFEITPRFGMPPSMRLSSAEQAALAQVRRQLRYRRLTVYPTHTLRSLRADAAAQERKFRRLLLMLRIIGEQGNNVHMNDIAVFAGASDLAIVRMVEEMHVIFAEFWAPGPAPDGDAPPSLESKLTELCHMIGQPRIDLGLDLIGLLPYSDEEAAERIRLISQGLESTGRISEALHPDLISAQEKLRAWRSIAVRH